MWSVSDLRDESAIEAGFAKVVHEVAAVSEYFGVPLTLPRHITKQDLESLDTLHKGITGESLCVSTWDGSIVKEKRLRESVAVLEGGQFDLQIRQRSNWKFLPLMGVVVDTGPVGLQMTKCSLESPDAFQKEYVKC